MLYQTKNPHGGDIYTGHVTLDFSANTNPYGTPEGVVRAMQNVMTELHRYPDPYCRKLVQAIADHEFLPPEYILCGNGAAELIYSFCDAIKPRCAMELAPTFSEYALALERVGCPVMRYELNADCGFQLDSDFLSVLSSVHPEVLFLCNPNNPTGCLIPPTVLEEILACCKEQGTFLFLDECFLDLSDDVHSMKEELPSHPNLFILKAFTKSYGMAGVRLGYGLCSNPELLSAMAKMVQPWNVSTLAQAAGIAALQETEFLQQTRRTIQTERTWLMAELDQLGLFVCSGKTNYVLFRGPEDLHMKLEDYGIQIRNCENYHGLSRGWFRIAVRLHHENERLIQAIREILTGSRGEIWQKIL